MNVHTQARVPTAAVRGLIEDCMLKVGVPAQDAAKIAELMLEADLIGADAHGVFRLPQYVQRLKLGSTNPRPNIKVERSAPATALVHGDNGMGHLVVARAAETAIELARETGVAWVGCVMSGHAGAAGVYAALPQYVQRLKLGSTNPRPNIKVERSAPATALVQGDNGMGHLVVARAAETAIELARETGVAWVGCVMSGHAGAAGVYAALPLKADMIGMYSAVANANHMPLAGGAEPLLGTNPFAIAIPAGEEPPVVLDIATSIVSYGTIKNHRLQNIPLHDDWMIDPETGEAITDPQKSARALLLPMAGYKGAGLALTFGLLAGTLNGALFGRDCVDFNAEPDRVTNTGQFVVALDPSRFQKLEHFKAEVDRHVRSLRNSKALPGQSVRIPGDQRAKRRADRLANGLALPAELLKQLDALAGETGARRLGER